MMVVNPSLRLPLAFVGMHDEAVAVKELWTQVWYDSVPGTEVGMLEVVKRS